MDKNKDLVEAFKWLFIGLLVCFGVSYAVSLNFNLLINVVGGTGWVIFAIVELVVCLLFSFLIKKISPTVAKILYIIYTALTGLTFSTIFIVYELSSIIYVFLITGVIFGIFALIGKSGKVDLSKWGIYLFIALIGVIVCSIINIFVKSEAFNLGLVILSIGIFSIYIAYDIHKLLNSNYLDDTENKGIYYAFQLFLDVINLFIRLLELFGKSRD